MFEIVAQNTDTAELLLYGSVGEWSRVNSRDVIAKIKEVEAKGYKKLILRMHSPGGSVFEGMAIIAYLQSSSLYVTAVIDGLAASMMSAIAVSCDEVHMAKGARMMIHQGSGGAYGQAKDILRTGKMLESLNRTLAEMYAAKSGKPVDDVLSEWMANHEDTWMTAKEALKAKLIDKVIAPTKKTPDASVSIEAFDEAFTNTIKPTNSIMKKEELIALLGLGDNAIEADIKAAITGLQATAAAHDKVTKACVALGKKQGIINEANEASMTKFAALDPAAVIDMIPAEAAKPDSGDSTSAATGEKKPAAQEEKPLTLSAVMAALQDAGSGEGSKKKEKWDDFSAKELDEMEENDPKKFDELFHAKYNS